MHAPEPLRHIGEVAGCSPGEFGGGVAHQACMNRICTYGSRHVCLRGDCLVTAQLLPAAMGGLVWAIFALWLPMSFEEVGPCDQEDEIKSNHAPLIWQGILVVVHAPGVAVVWQVHATPPCKLTRCAMGDALRVRRL
jgi:hypothetical protein